MEQAAIEGLAGRKVVVTGATGFIGRRVVPALRAAGAEVTVIARGGAGGSLPPGVRWVTGDLGRPAGLSSALAGQEVLVHLAYDLRASAAKNLADFDGLLAAAGSAGVGRIVHASSIVVHDGWPDRDLDETGPMAAPGGSPYRRAKIAMEERLMAGPLPALILQPTLVWGPGSAMWTDHFARLLASGGCVVLPEPEGLCNAVFVDDLAQAVVRAAALPDPGHERFIISGAAPLAWGELIGGYARILGRGSLRHAPRAALAARLGPRATATEVIPDRPSLAARISAAARQVIGRDRFEALVARAQARLGPKGGDHFPDWFLLDLYSAAGTCRIDHARARLGYAPAFGLQAGLDATAPYLIRRFGKA